MRVEGCEKANMKAKAGDFAEVCVEVPIPFTSLGPSLTFFISDKPVLAK